MRGGGGGVETVSGDVGRGVFGCTGLLRPERCAGVGILWLGVLRGG